MITNSDTIQSTVHHFVLIKGEIKMQECGYCKYLPFNQFVHISQVCPYCLNEVSNVRAFHAGVIDGYHIFYWKTPNFCRKCGKQMNSPSHCKCLNGNGHGYPERVENEEQFQFSDEEYQNVFFPHKNNVNR
jgi:hypothetical protein